MSQYAMPFLIVNYGVEMLFILNNRLAAQKNEASKVHQIMHDVTVTMFNDQFLDELFRPQKIYTVAATRDVFLSLSKSSIMHLSSNSMQTLFALMRMGVKYQLLTLHHPWSMLEYTLNHLEALLPLVPVGTKPSVTKVQERFLALHQSLSVGAYAQIRYELLNLSLGFRVKVSLFMTSKVQNPDGTFNLPSASFLAPGPTNEPPGTIRTYSGGKLLEQTTFPHGDAKLPVPLHVPRGSWNPVDCRTRFSRNGFNMYTQGPDVLGAQTRELPGAAAATAATTPQDAEADAFELQVGAYGKEMNILSHLAGRQSRMANETVKLSLFEDEEKYVPPAMPVRTAAAPVAAVALPPPVTAPRPSAAPPPPRPVPEVPAVARMSSGAVREENRRLLDIASGMGDRSGGEHTGGGADLLDIMDDI
ncbi:organic solute carrier partner 1 [Strigomonas culicis]|uniref:Organic solute carrier partner 1 n=1 Tax=Strigomonas culicis TaxID=28005 RepID=S9TN67_9TRYP|nr:organic solute carrier partner 1 [Strigomonas culicis]|eukprot:EPY19717.1 organic solute carrier partner 1 [Strigomonas culicis]